MSAVVVGVRGRFPLVAFEQSGGLLSCALPAPGAVPVLYFALTAPLAQGVGAALYYSLPPFDDLQFLALVANECPAQIVSTGFATDAAAQACAECRLAVRLDVLESFREAYLLTQERAARAGFPQKVATHLFNFLGSFDRQSVNGREALVVPPEALDRWLARFEARARVDPCFLDR